MSAFAAAKDLQTSTAARPAWSRRSPVGARRWGTAMVMLMRIERWDPRRDGPLSERALRLKLEARGYHPTPHLYPAGAVAAAQAADRERIDAVVTGLMKVTLDGESAILTAGDVVFVPRGAVRRVEVVGSSPLHCLEAVYRGEPA
jgi:mannose-6-phosphate isomerase-like protein (cupin superfamily)